MQSTRRKFLQRGGAGLAAGIALLPPSSPAQTSCRRVSGAGSYSLGPFEHAEQKNQQVFLVTDLGFDETLVWCKITTNFEPFIMPTARLGLVRIGAHELFMDMQSTRIDSLEIRTGSDGPQAVYAGRLRSETRLFSGARTMTIVEDEVVFDCEASDLGPAATVEVSKNNFSMTVKLDPAKEHAAIFGERVTFAGHLTRGNVTVAGMPGNFTPVVTGVTVEPATVRQGGSFVAAFAGVNLTDLTYFDVRFRRPGSEVDELAFNWQRGVTARQDIAGSTAPGIWRLTGVRPHQNVNDHTGGFSLVAATITVTV